VSCSPILAVYFYLLCRSRHSSQTCIGICRFRKQADVLVTTTPKSKKFQIEATLLRNRGDLPSVTLVEQVLRDVCRFVSATQHACNVGYEQTFSRRHMHEKQMSSNDQVGHRRMIIDMMPVDALTKCNCSRSVPSKTHRIFQDRHSSQMRKCKTGLLLIIQDQKNARNVIEEALFSC